MTNEELVGKMMGAVSRIEKSYAAQKKSNDELQVIVKELHRQVMFLRYQVHHLACMRHPTTKRREEDTDPQCPAVLSDRPPAHHELFDADLPEPDSALLRQMEFRASKSSFAAKGPSVMVFAWSALIGGLLLAGFIVWALLKYRAGA